MRHNFGEAGHGGDGLRGATSLKVNGVAGKSACVSVKNAPRWEDDRQNDAERSARYTEALTDQTLRQTRRVSEPQTKWREHSFTVDPARGIISSNLQDDIIRQSHCARVKT